MTCKIEFQNLRKNTAILFTAAMIGGLVGMFLSNFQRVMGDFEGLKINLCILFGVVAGLLVIAFGKIVEFFFAYRSHPETENVRFVETVTFDTQFDVRSQPTPWQIAQVLLSFREVRPSEENGSMRVSTVSGPFGNEETIFTRILGDSAFRDAVRRVSGTTDSDEEMRIPGHYRIYSNIRAAGSDMVIRYKNFPDTIDLSTGEKFEFGELTPRKAPCFDHEVFCFCDKDTYAVNSHDKRIETKMYIPRKDDGSMWIYRTTSFEGGDGTKYNVARESSKYYFSKPFACEIIQDKATPVKLESKTILLRCLSSLSPIRCV